MPHPIRLFIVQADRVAFFFEKNVMQLTINLIEFILKSIRICSATL